MICIDMVWVVTCIEISIYYRLIHIPMIILLEIGPSTFLLSHALNRLNNLLSLMQYVFGTMVEVVTVS